MSELIEKGFEGSERTYNESMDLGNVAGRETMSEMSDESETSTEGDYDRTVPSEPDVMGADIGTNETMESSSNTRGVNINPLNSGYLVKVGCQSVAVETTEKLVDMLSKYLTDPSGFERKWYSKDVRNRLENIA